MTSIMDGVDQRTRLVGSNRLELLLFYLKHSQQVYGINVFKVREAIPCPPLTKMPHAHPVIKGVAHIRGVTTSVFDLSMAIGGPPVDDIQNSFIIITEYNRNVQGFLVDHIERIINISWEEVLPPPSSIGADNYLTAITKLDDKIIEIIDVEKVLAEVVGEATDVSENLADGFSTQNSEKRPHVLVADDSSVARKQIVRTMEKIGIDTTVVNDGKQALEQLQTWVDEGIDINRHVDMLISDIEMPEMDGYSLTTAVKKDPQLQQLKVLLHSSMSGDFNNSLIEQTGADKFIPKFEPDELASAVQELLNN